MIPFDFDSIERWAPSLFAHVSGLVPPDGAVIIRDRQPEFIEDAADILFSHVCADKEGLVEATSAWIKSQTVAAYHGSRLTDSDIKDITDKGLIALTADARKEHLRRKLSRHPAWPDAARKLDSVVADLGVGHLAGKREGQVHATLSRAGLLNGFNHYLTHGSEFDQHAAYYLVGDGGKELLTQYGRPTLITLAIPGDRALDAANPFNVRDMPNFVREVLNVWAYWLAYPAFSVASQKFDCGLMFWGNLPVEWIVSIDRV